ncbi:MAG: hypothetical protein JNK74_03995 [Candidatus Hydrogenedentes bacterium]|jgi:hypothetical protein|nr:hypothetical protein [Candidatus Hydrogenedentota bacterium]
MGTSDLDKRDKGTLFFAGLFVLLALFMAVYVPSSLGKRYKSAKGQLAQKQQELQLAQLDLLAEQDRVQSQEKLLAVLNARDPRFDLFSFVNGVLKEAKLSDRAKLEIAPTTRNSSPNHPMVELELNGVSLEELIELFYKVGGSNNLIAVHKMSIKPAVKARGLVCELSLVTLKV